MRRAKWAASLVSALSLGVFLLHAGGAGNEPALAAEGAANEKAKEAPAGKVYGEWCIRIRPDKGADYNRLIEKEGLPLFRAAGGRMVGWWKTAVGDLYEQVTLWEYDGLAAYEKAGTFLGKNERFARFVDQRDPLLAGESSRFLELADWADPPTLPTTDPVVVHEIHRVPLNRMEPYLEFMRHQLPMLKRHGFRPVGPLRTAVGRWTEITYLFRFESLAERDRLIAGMAKHPDGQDYGKGVSEFVDEVSTRILTPAPHSR
jgi:hypothetical protein